MGHYGVSPATALDALTSLAAQAGITLYAIADTLIQAHLSCTETSGQPGTGSRPVTGTGTAPETGNDPLTMIAAALHHHRHPRNEPQP